MVHKEGTTVLALIIDYLINFIVDGSQRRDHCACLCLIILWNETLFGGPQSSIRTLSTPCKKIFNLLSDGLRSLRAIRRKNFEVTKPMKYI